MNQKTIPDFIIIDDDPINNMICDKIIGHAIPGATVQTFTDPEKGLAYIYSACSESITKKAILFLDINMLPLTGWDILDRISDCSDSIKKGLKIFILSSSVDLNDKEKAADHPLVSGYLIKPISQEKLKEIALDYAQSAYA